MLPKTSIGIKPIPPSEIVNAAHNAGEKLINYVQGMADPLATFTVAAAGIVILAGLILMAIGITRKIFTLGVYLLIGTAIMYLFTNQPVEIMGVIKGVIMGLFSGIGGGGN